MSQYNLHDTRIVHCMGQRDNARMLRVALLRMISTWGEWRESQRIHIQHIERDRHTPWHTPTDTQTCRTHAEKVLMMWVM